MYELTLILIVLFTAIAVSAWWLRRSFRRAVDSKDDGQSLALLQNQIHAMSSQSAAEVHRLRESVQSLGEQINRGMNETQHKVGERIEGTTRMMQGVSRQLGLLEESSRRIFDLGKSIAGLEEVLKAPKLRGNMGELLLEDLLSQILPAAFFRMQYAFRGGEAVDAVLLLRNGMVPVDAKFPLENFRRISAAEEDGQRREARKEFVRDVKKHVASIASKYIRPDEGTFDFALMYIPAENVYYETIIKDEERDGPQPLFAYALERRVIPVSPNSFYAYLQTITLGLKGMQVEERAREIINHLSRLRKEFGGFEDDFRLLGQHLDHSRKKYEDAEKRLGRLSGKLEQIEQTAAVRETDSETSLAGKDAPAVEGTDLTT